MIDLTREVIHLYMDQMNQINKDIDHATEFGTYQDFLVCVERYDRLARVIRPILQGYDVLFEDDIAAKDFKHDVDNSSEFLRKVIEGGERKFWEMRRKE